jgi:hypothetical protein
MASHSTRCPRLASNIGVFGAILLLIIMSLNTTVNCFSGRMSPRRRTTSAP